MGKERRRRKEGRLRGGLGILLAAAMLFNTLFSGGLSVYASDGKSALVDEGTPDLELFGQKVSSGDSGDGWSYADGVLTLENFHSDNSSGNFIHITNAPLEFTIYVKGENSVNTSGTLFYGNVRGSTTIMGDEGASLSLEGQNWNDKDIFIRGVNVNVTTQGMIFLSHNMVIDNAMVNFNMNGSNGYIYNTHGGLTIENGSEVNITNSSGSVDYCVATNKTEINDSTLNITNPSGFGVYVTAISKEVPEHKAFITNSTISADVLDAGIHCEDEVSVTNSQVTNSGRFLLRSKKAIIVDKSSTMEGITYEFFKSDSGAAYQVYGTHALAADLTVAANGSFVIPKGAALTIPNGVTLENNGTMHIHEKNSLTGTGALAGDGNFLIDVNKDMISIPESLTYTGKDYTDQIILEREILICGVEFTADTTGWIRTIEPAVVKDVGDYTVTFTNGDRTISRDFKVGECPHTGLVYMPLADGRHGGTCPLCNEEISEEHKWADGVCSLCNVKAVAMLESNGSVLSYYDESSLDSAFRMAKNLETLKLLGDVTATHKIQSESIVTLDLNGHTYDATQIGDSAFQISYNIIMVKDSVGGGKVTAAAGYACFDLEGGTMSFYGGTFSGGKCAVNVTGTCSLNLHGGTFNGSENAIKHTDNIKTALANHNAFYQDGSPYEPSGKSLPAGTFIVQKCKHEGVKPTSNNDGTHSLTCPYCGYAGTAESCVYSEEYICDTTNHTQTCTVCGYQKVEAHTIALSAEASGNTVTLREGCGVCDHGSIVGAVNFTFPKVVYGETGTVLTGDRTVPEQYAMFLQMDDGAMIQGEGETVSWSAADLFGSETMAVGEHKLKVSFANDIGKYSNVCELPFTVERAPLTADMMTLDKTDVTYNGTEQKTTLTVKQGETRLTLGTDYEVRYTRDGIATTDFTSAGTVTITIKGKGNYTGEVEKTFTIEQAAPDVGAVTAGALENTLDVSQVVLSRTNQTTAGTLTLTDSALKYGTNTYTWKFTPDDTVNYKTVTGEVNITVNDTIPPNAEYQIDTDGWRKFLNNVSFGVFGKDYKTVEIRATDDTDTVTGSGIKQTQYYISDKEITDTDSIVWNTYTKPVSLNAQGAYFIYVKVTDNAGNTAVLNSEGIVVYAESTVSPSAIDYTYKENHDRTVQLALNGNTFKGLTDEEGNAVDANHYTIDSDGTLILKAAYLDTLDKGGYTYKAVMNPQGIETEQVTLAYTFTVNVKAKELTVTGATATDRAYDGTKMVEITAVKLSGAAPDDDVAVALKNGIQGTLNSADAGTYTAVTLPELILIGADSGNYSLVQPAAAVSTSVTVNPLDAEITVGTDTYNKTFGDAAFTLDVTDNNTEAEVQYEVTKGADVISVENGTVTLRGAGEAEITVLLPESANYSAAENKTITVIVEKAQNAPNMPEDSINVLNTVKKAGGAPLPKGWKWQEADKEKALAAGASVEATAIYTGEDKGNYEKETVTVTITRAACDDASGELLYTGKSEKAPTCTEDGLGHKECSLCGDVIESGIVVKAPGHEWHITGEEAATTTSEGKRVYTCYVCSQTREETIPKLPPTANPTLEEPAKQPKETVAPEEVRENPLKLDSSISMKWKGNALALKWAKITGAGGYDIYVAQCGKKRKNSLAKTVKNGKTSVSLTKITGKKISGKKTYSVKIKAWEYVNGKKVYTASSRTYHIAGKENKKYTNAKKLKLKKKYTLKKGRSIRVQVTIDKQSKKKKLLPVSHGPALKYQSGNKKIAAVTQAGKVKAKKKGTCYIYVTALNGVREKIKITVK